MTRRIARIGLILALGAGAVTMAYFFEDPDPRVALAALTAWALFIVAMMKAPRP